MKKQKVLEIIEEFRKEDCRCKLQLKCLRCAILEELKERIENENRSNTS